MKEKHLYIIISLLLFVFLLIRSIFTPLAHDEIATFFYYIQEIDWNPLNGANPDANNHILNSILAGITHKYLGYSAFNIRLPNLLSFIPYTYFVYKIGINLTKKESKWMFYIGMLFPIYFIQFFALSRGYGMSMAFLIGAIYYTLNLYSKKSLVNLTFSTICLLLAVYANMSLLPLSLLIFTFMGILVLSKRKEYSSPISLLVISINIFTTFISLYFALKIAFKMKNEGSLYYGKLDGFWDVTINSELLMLFENHNLISQTILIGILISIGVIYFLKLLKDKLKSLISPEYFFFYLLITVFVGIISMAIIMNINYPEDRVGMYFYPLLIGTICFGIDSSSHKLSKYFLIPILIIPLHFILNINFNKISIWTDRYVSNEFYETIKSHKTDTKYPATVSGDSKRLFTYNEKIYQDKNKSNNSIQSWEKSLFDTTRGKYDLILPNHPGKYHDFLLSKPKYIKDILSLFDSIGYEKATQLALYKRKKATSTSLLQKTNKISNSETSNEYFEFYHETYDSLDYDAMMLGFDLEIQSLSHPFKSRVVIEIRVEDKLTGKFNKIDEHFFQLNWMYPRTEAINPIIKNAYISNLKHFANNRKIEIVAYLWNIDKKPYSIYKGEIEIYKVVE